ncbi:MAG TPA: cation-translocating P-type ATPase [Firmicutes bacterium]|nr:cation-translocating P-type ATPase [Bacillota bacterium]
MLRQPAVAEKRSRQGLTSGQAASRLAADGPNQLASGKKISAMKIFAGQFKDLLVLILLAATVISVFIGEYAEAVTIAVIVLANAVLGFIQEFRTERTLEALKRMAAPHARVYRDGKLCEIPAAELVCGDLIVVEAGDRIPADGVLLDAVSLQCDESILTGESAAVEKMVDPAADAGQLNQSGVVYMGCTVVKGHGRVRLTATGMRTQMGKIAGMLGDIEEEQTPLQKRLDELGKYIAIGCLIICAVISLAGILRGYQIMDMFITGVSLAVAAVPEGLAATITIALALAVGRMVKRNALVRRLHAVETLGCASVICSDKTGTLTENKMTATQIYTLSHSLSVSGNGYERAGEFKENGMRVCAQDIPEVRQLLTAAVLCNNAELQDEETLRMRDRSRNRMTGQWTVSGEPTETALLVLAAKSGITSRSLQGDYERLDEIPFDSTRKCMSVVLRTGSGRRYLFTKGAYDVIIGKCLYADTSEGRIPLGQTQKAELEKANRKMAENALRVLGFAWRELAEGEQPKEEKLVFLGLTGMIDPPRREVKQAVATCARAGIRTVMITGDHQITACAIAQKIGIMKPGDRSLTGAELDQMSDDELFKQVGKGGKVCVFARVNPGHKLRIVRAFKRHGEIVAMTGDGVNDAPAVKEADIGVSMGIGGSDVTKEASDVILLDDNFATLVAAVEEGRVIYGNIRKFIRYLISCNIGEVLTMFVGMLMGMPVVLLPIQILLVNLVTDGLPAIALGLEPADGSEMKRPPRNPKDSVFSGGLLSTIIFRGILIGLTTLGVFTLLFRMTSSLDIARTGAFLALVMTQLIHVFECKSETKTIFSMNLLNNKKLLAAVATSLAVVFGAIYIEPLHWILGTTSLTAEQLFLTFGCSASVPLVSALFHGLSNRLIKKDSGSPPVRRQEKIQDPV